MSVDIRAASSFSLAELAAVFTAAYEGYLVPFQVDEGAMRFMVEAFDIDLASSRVALADSEPIGLANLAVRGDRSWVGGVGVVPGHRRTGVGRALMDALLEEGRSLGLREVTLEVLEQNEAAYRLYADLGFQTTRWVGIWSLAAGESAGGARPVDELRAHERIRALRRATEPWQRADETLAHYRRHHPRPLALEADGGASIYRPGERLQLLQIAGDRTSARSLFAELRAGGQVGVLNLPDDEPAAAALEDLGAVRTLRQREMALAL